MNFAMHPLAAKYSEWKFDGERDYLANSDSYIFRNTFRDIALVARELGEGEGVFRTSALTLGTSTTSNSASTRACSSRRSSSSSSWATRGHRRRFGQSRFMKRTADRLFGDGYRWSVLGAASQMDLAVAATAMGGNT
ncbi:uncharacterized protein (DUF849 family) [Variovorax guangxiensis]|nr:hypothetical protein [Variovorax guangxiensis]MDR6860368.1 uncharacterized protein (DUF849 family) [Variovorax guangxiensis]